MQVIDKKQLHDRDKHRSIVRQLKRDIVGGVYLPGSKLPRRRDMEERFGVSNMTMQLAMDRLRRDGFVNTNGRNGTNVSAFPPHLYHYGLVFPGRPQRHAVPWTRFWDGLHREAQALNETGPRWFTSYMEVSEHVDDPDRIRLMEDIQAQRLAGLLLVQLFDSVSSPIIAQTPAVPCVSITAKADPAAIALNVETGFMARALDHLQRRGRKRIAFVTGPRLQIMDGLEQLLAQRGMTSERYWDMEFHLHLPGPAKNWLELLMRQPESQRPDGLVITDDNLVEAATTGIAAAGVRVPEQLDIVAHCNFPWVTTSVVPSRRLGFDARRIISTAIAAIEDQRRGLTPRSPLVIPLQFEDELSKVPGPVQFPSPSVLA